MIKHPGLLIFLETVLHFGHFILLSQWIFKVNSSIILSIILTRKVIRVLKGSNKSTLKNKTIGRINKANIEKKCKGAGK